VESFDLIGAEPTRGLLVRVRNVPQLVAKQGGLPGAVAAKLVPNTIEAVVLTKMAEQMRPTLHEKGVEADVQVVTTATLPRFRDGLLLGLGAAGGLWAVWRFGLSKLL
jgi:hypothetical protein